MPMIPSSQISEGAWGVLYYTVPPFCIGSSEGRGCNITFCGFCTGMTFSALQGETQHMHRPLRSRPQQSRLQLQTVFMAEVLRLGPSDGGKRDFTTVQKDG